MVTENLVEFMRENKKYIAIANEPYYFMEYFLHVVNQEEDADRSLYWFETLLSLYMHPGAEQHLFYENDFRILVDILVRHIENYRDGKPGLTQSRSWPSTWRPTSCSPSRPSSSGTTSTTSCSTSSSSSATSPTPPPPSSATARNSAPSCRRSYEPHPCQPYNFISV